MSGGLTTLAGRRKVVFCVRRLKMLKKYWKLSAVLILVGTVLCMIAYAAERSESAERGESEHKVTREQVPAAALAALEKLAAGAEITEFAEEVEHGQTFYEGSYKNRSGTNTDALVTPAGDAVEIEEQVDAYSVPAAVLKAATEAAGKGNRLTFEKKTTILYEIHFRKGGERHELVLTPDGRHNEKEGENGENGENDETE
jgi:hypothetical protein